MFKSRKNQCSYIIFLALFLFFNPILVLAQTGSVTLSMKNATLKQFFEAVEKQTTYIFSYRDAIVEGKKEVTLKLRQLNGLSSYIASPFDAIHHPTNAESADSSRLKLPPSFLPL